MMNNKTFSAMCEELLAAERKMSQYKTCCAIDHKNLRSTGFDRRIAKYCLTFV